MTMSSKRSCRDRRREHSKSHHTKHITYCKEGIAPFNSGNPTAQIDPECSYAAQQTLSQRRAITCLPGLGFGDGKSAIVVRRVFAEFQDAGHLRGEPPGKHHDVDLSCCRYSSDKPKVLDHTSRLQEEPSSSPHVRNPMSLLVLAPRFPEISGT